MKKFAPLFLAFAVLFSVCFYGLSINNQNTVPELYEPTVSDSDSQENDIRTTAPTVSNTPEIVDLSQLSAPYGTKPATSVDEVVNNVYNYIIEFELHPTVDQDYASFRSKEMHDIFIALDNAVDAGKTSIGLSSQELTTLQDYMIGTAKPYNYASKEFTDADYRENTSLYVLPYKVQYVYKDEDDFGYSILIDYDNNMFLANAKGRVKVELDLVRTTVLSTVYQMLNDPRVRFHNSNISFCEGNEKCGELPDRCSVKYPKLDELTEKVYSFVDSPRAYPSIDDDIIINVSAEELISLYNFMQDTPSMNYSLGIMSKRYDDGWLSISDYYLYTSSNDDILFVGIEYSDGNANLYLSNQFDTKQLPYFKVVLDSSSKECQNKILDTINISARPPEKPYYASYSDVDITWHPAEKENVDSVKLLVNNMESFVRNNKLLITQRQNYASYASSDMYRIWNKLHIQAIEHPEKDEIKLRSEDLTTLQYYMTEVALPESASVLDEPDGEVETIANYCIGYEYDDGHTAKFEISILFDKELYLSCGGSNSVRVVI